MDNKNSFSAGDKLTVFVKSLGIETWGELTEYVKNLPYGRNSNRIDFSLVLSEMKGTCSSKHALLKTIADKNHIPNVDLIIGIYRMTERNTPKIGLELTNNSLKFIPEAHCYLKINGERMDFTSKKAQFSNIENDIIVEKSVVPEQVGEFKVEYHKSFIKKWLNESNSSFEFSQIWAIRENCIKNLTK